MSLITADVPPPLLPPPAPLPKRGHPLLAWLVIAVAVVVAASYEQIASFCSPQLAARMKARSDRAYLSGLQLQGREIVGMVESFGQSSEVADPQIKEGLEHGPYEQRLRFIILEGELHGPAKALEQLSAMRETYWEQRPPTDREVELTELVEKLYRGQLHRLVITAVSGSVMIAAEQQARAESANDDKALSLTEEERGKLRKKLDWFGDLALVPANDSDAAARAAVLATAKRTALMVVLVGISILMLASMGFMLLVAGVFFLATGLVRMRFLCGSRDGGLYAETFALWMVLYMALEVAAMFVPAGRSRLLVAGLFGLSSLVVLAWPVLRGVTWRRVRQDLGWWTPGPIGFEVLWGLGCYLASLPLVLLGVLASTGLLKLYNLLAGEDPFSIPIRPTHPVTEILQNGGVWEYVQIFLVAAVFAPFIEETMFRGVLYRHLREIGTKWPRAASVLVSILVVSFVFAVIHPQGFLGVPMLMALAAGFALAREIRGSLVGSIAAHGVNNALVTLVALSLN